MMTRTGFAHLLGVLIIPVLTRLYTPDEIGLYASYLSMFTILYSVASLRFEYATLIPAPSARPIMLRPWQRFW